MNENKVIALLIGIPVAIFVMLVVTALVVSLIQASAQQQVWKRQGVDMTFFEVFMGAKPIVRQMVVEEAK